MVGNEVFLCTYVICSTNVGQCDNRVATWTEAMCLLCSLLYTLKHVLHIGLSYAHACGIDPKLLNKEFTVFSSVLLNYVSDEDISSTEVLALNVNKICSVPPSVLIFVRI